MGREGGEGWGERGVLAYVGAFSPPSSWGPPNLQQYLPVTMWAVPASSPHSRPLSAPGRAAALSHACCCPLLPASEAAMPAARSLLRQLWETQIKPGAGGLFRGTQATVIDFP